MATSEKGLLQRLRLAHDFGEDGLLEVVGRQRVLVEPDAVEQHLMRGTETKPRVVPVAVPRATTTKEPSGATCGKLERPVRRRKSPVSRRPTS